MSKHTSGNTDITDVESVRTFSNRADALSIKKTNNTTILNVDTVNDEVKVNGTVNATTLTSSTLSTNSLSLDRLLMTTSASAGNIDTTHFCSSTSSISNILRRDASYSGEGGQANYVNSALRVITTARENTGQYEWALSAALNNYSEDSVVENNGGYLQCYKYGDSKSWAATIGA